MMQRSVGLRANSPPGSRGQNRVFQDAAVSPPSHTFGWNGLRALRANASGVRSNLPGTPAEGLFSLSPTPSESPEPFSPCLPRALFLDTLRKSPRFFNPHPPSKLTWYFQTDILSLCAVHEPEAEARFLEKCVLIFGG